jgi:hypothetical protein
VIDLERLSTAILTNKPEFYTGDVREGLIDALEELTEAREKLAEIRDALGPV